MRKEYSGIPGTTVFDGEQSRRGYHLNQFCMSLLIPANRDRFKADEEAYLSEWNLTEKGLCHEDITRATTRRVDIGGFSSSHSGPSPVTIIAKSTH